MTETLGHGDLAARINHALQKLGGLLGKAGFGIFLLFAAIAALVATTVIGLMLAIAAVFLTFAHAISRPSRRNGTGDPDTLEARRTADGWVIEG
jgi:hypothetical protein